MEFKIGDRVRVIDSPRILDQFRNQIGTITYVDDKHHVIRVDLDDIVRYSNIPIMEAGWLFESSDVHIVDKSELSYDEQENNNIKDFIDDF